MQWTMSSPKKQWQQKVVHPHAINTEPSLITTTDKRQSVLGFGGCFNEMGWHALQSLPDQEKEQVLAALFDSDHGCDFRLCRVPMGANDYALDWYSHNETPHDFEMQHFSITRDEKCLLPYIRSAIEYQPDMRLFASPWSPPTWMKQPPVYNYGRFIDEASYYQAYALYFLKFVETYRRAGIPVQQVHVQNEPDSNQRFPSCVWTAEKLLLFIRDFLGPLFEKVLPDCEIWLGTLERGEYDEWANVILQDVTARKYLTGVGYQWAGRNAVLRTAVSHPEKLLLQTENECRNGQNSWEDAHYVFNLMWDYFTSGVHGYVYWNMILPSGGESTWGWKQNSMIAVDPVSRKATYNPEYFVMKHFSAFIKPGAHRISIQGSWTGNTLGFLNFDDSCVLCLFNPFREIRSVTVQHKDDTFSLDIEPQSINTMLFD